MEAGLCGMQDASERLYMAVWLGSLERPLTKVPTIMSTADDGSSAVLSTAAEREK